MKETPLSELTCAQFAAHRHSKFLVGAGRGAPVELELVEVEPQPPSRSAGAVRGECFSLVFTGPATPLLSQGTYSFGHAVLGSFSLFLVPISKDRERACYEAVFNRRAPR